ncbi:MAG: 50S ribosomal protein L1 [Wenzhouxiangellaceae bacterium]
MVAQTKRNRAIREKIEPGKQYALDEALGLLKDLSKVKFTESVDVAVRLGVDPRKSDQVVRGSTVLPHGTGKDVRVAVFAQGENAEKALAAGADVVGFDDLAETIKGGTIDFDVCIATPDAMRVVGKLGQVLGPRGLMPNPKVGTVTTDVEQAVKNAKAGQVQFRTDKGGIVHTTIGKADFEVEALKGNLQALVQELVKAKPAAAKGQYLRKIAISTTMGPGLTVDNATLGL